MGLSSLDEEKAQGVGQCPIAAHSHLRGGSRKDRARPLSKGTHWQRKRPQASFSRASPDYMLGELFLITKS